MTELDTPIDMLPAYEVVPECALHAEIGRIAQLTQEWNRRTAAVVLGLSALTGCTATGSQTTSPLMPAKPEKVIAINHTANTMTTAGCTQESQRINNETRHYSRCNPTVGHLKEQTVSQVKAAGGGTRNYTGAEKANCDHPSNAFIDSLSLGDVFKKSQKTTQKLTDRGGRTGAPVTICTWSKQ